MTVARRWVGQGSTYVAFGLVQLALDTTIFVGLSTLGISLAAANFTGRLAGACLGYVVNGRVTFATPGHDGVRWPAFGRFAFLWLVLTILGTILLRSVEDHFGLVGSWYAKPMVEASLAVLGFLAMKFFVFPQPATDLKGGR